MDETWFYEILFSKMILKNEVVLCIAEVTSNVTNSNKCLGISTRLYIL